MEQLEQGIIGSERMDDSLLTNELEKIAEGMNTAIQGMKERGEREGFIKGTPGIGKTTFYCNIAKKAEKPVMILLPSNAVYSQIQGWIGETKKTIIINTTQIETLETIIKSIDTNTVLITNYKTFNSIHKKHPQLFKELMYRLGYLFSDELHRGIGKQTILAMQDIIGNTKDINSFDDAYEISAEEEDADMSLDSAMKINTELLHVGFTGTPTYTHKSVYNNFKCIYNYTTERALERGIVTPLKEIDIGEGIQYVESPRRNEKDLESGYKEFYIEKEGKFLPVADAVLSKVIELKQKEPIHALGVCATINQIKEEEIHCKEKGLRTYCVHSGNKTHRGEGSLEEAKQKIEAEEIDMILVCNTGIEVLDIPKLNTLAYFYAPCSPVKLNQSIGRITRPCEAKSHANIIIPKTKIVFAAQEERIIKNRNKVKTISETVGRLDWKDVYYTLGDFSEEYLKKHGIYSKEYIAFLKLQISKREEIEKTKVRLLEKIEIRLKDLGLQESKLLYKFLDEIAVIQNSKTVLNECMDIVSYSKNMVLKESGRQTTITNDDLESHLKSLEKKDTEYPGVDTKNHKFFDQKRVNMLLEDKQRIVKKFSSTPTSDSIEKHSMRALGESHIDTRNKLVLNSLPIVVAIANIFGRYINRAHLQGLTVEDIIQECIVENIIVTDIYDSTTYTRYYETICWNTIKTITTLLVKHNNKVPIDEEKFVGNSNELNRLIGILNDIYTIKEEETLKISNEIISDPEEKYGTYNEYLPDRLLEILNHQNHSTTNGMERFNNEVEKEIFFALINDGGNFETTINRDITDTEEMMENLFIHEDFYATWERMKNPITERRKEIIELFLGLKQADHGRTLEEIGEKFDLTGERVRQMKERGITKLRRDLLKKLLKEYLGHEIKKYIEDDKEEDTKKDITL